MTRVTRRRRGRARVDAVAGERASERTNATRRAGAMSIMSYNGAAVIGASSATATIDAREGEDDDRGTWGIWRRAGRAGGAEGCGCAWDVV